MKHIVLTSLLALLVFAFPAGSKAATITLNSLTESVMVGLNDTNSAVAPAGSPGDGWYTSTYAGTLRGRVSGTNTNEQWRTQWNFRFESSALAGVTAADITNAELTIPQIGRLNATSSSGSHIRLYANTYDWSDDGSVDYPTWNRGRTDSGGDGTTIGVVGGANDHGLVKDTSNTNVEGSFVVDNAALLAAVKTWATNPADNEGFLMTYQNAEYIGLAFGTLTLEITTIPEPSSVSVLMLAGVGLLVRRRRR